MTDDIIPIEEARSSKVKKTTLAPQMPEEQKPPRNYRRLLAGLYVDFEDVEVAVARGGEVHAATVRTPGGLHIYLRMTGKQLDGPAFPRVPACGVPSTWLPVRGASY